MLSFISIGVVWSLKYLGGHGLVSHFTLGDAF